MTASWMKVSLLCILFPCFVTTAYSCTKGEDFGVLSVNETSMEVDTVSVMTKPYKEWEPDSSVKISEFGPLSFYHQSAARYQHYAFFVKDGRSEICLYDLKSKTKLYTLSLKVQNRKVYHCNQSTFGVEKYDPSDFFPLLYISQRDKSGGRCMLDAYRILPVFDDGGGSIVSFNVQLVQTVYLPPMSSSNSLGNANCAIDASKKVMYVYSRNNNDQDDNYQMCKISEFAIPDVHRPQVVLEDTDILSSFMLDISAVNMQGGCIDNGMLYIGQGLYSAGYILLNVIDLEKKELAMQVDLMELGVRWEPEGCFFYDGSVMLAHTGAICRIEKYRKWLH